MEGLELMFSRGEWQKIIDLARLRTLEDRIAWSVAGEGPLYYAELGSGRAISVRAKDFDDQAPYVVNLLDIESNKKESFAELVSSEFTDFEEEPYVSVGGLYTAIKRQLAGVDIEFKRIVDLLERRPNNDFPF